MALFSVERIPGGFLRFLVIIGALQVSIRFGTTLEVIIRGIGTCIK